MAPRTTTPAPAAIHAVLQYELTAWEVYWDPDSASKEHRLYVPGMILDLRATLQALRQGVTYGDPASYARIQLTSYWISHFQCRRVRTQEVRRDAWKNWHSTRTARDWKRVEQKLILWHPADKTPPKRWEVPKLGGLDHENTGSPRRTLWMPWLPAGITAPRPTSAQLTLL